MRIIDAVFDRLRVAPAERIVIDRIARDARVARSTVYAIFGSRAGLFDAVGRELASRSGYASLVDAKHQPDARDHLRAGFRASGEMLAANRDIYRALRSMAQLDEQAVGGVVSRMDEERAAGMARLAGRLAEQGVLREGLTAADAERVLWVLTSFESFDLLFTGRGLSTRQATDILVDMAERALYTLPPCSPESSRSSARSRPSRATATGRGCDPRAAARAARRIGDSINVSGCCLTVVVVRRQHASPSRPCPRRSLARRSAGSRPGAASTWRTRCAPASRSAATSCRATSTAWASSSSAARRAIGLPAALPRTRAVSALPHREGLRRRRRGQPDRRGAARRRLRGRARSRIPWTSTTSPTLDVGRLRSISRPT